MLQTLIWDTWLRSSDIQVLGRPQKPLGPGFFTHKARGRAEWPLLFFLVWRFYKEKMSSWKEEVQFSFWWAGRVDGTFTMPCFLIISIGGPPAVSPSRVWTLQRLESLPLPEHPSANWPFHSSRTGGQQVRNHLNRCLEKPWTQLFPCCYFQARPAHQPVRCHNVLLDFLEDYLPLFEWPLITLTFQVGTKFPQLGLQKNRWVTGESCKGKSLLPLLQSLCGYRQIIFFAWLNHTQYLLIGKEFRREKSCYQTPPLPPSLPSLPQFKDFSIFKFILFIFSLTDKNGARCSSFLLAYIFFYSDTG